MLQVCIKLAPSEVWLLGASQGYMALELKRHSIPARRFSAAAALDLTVPDESCVVFAVGNIAGGPGFDGPHPKGGGSVCIVK